MIFKRKPKKIRNLVATDGFHFSGSGLVNDIFRECEYVVPANIRADELFTQSDNFSWPCALNGDYLLSRRFKLLTLLVKKLIVRIPLNFVQRTPLYTRYLAAKGRGETLHQSSSVNRSLWSYLVSIRMILLRGEYDQSAFVNWLYLKYIWHVGDRTNLLLDNGIPREKKLANWFFGVQGASGIIVYRDPRVQYQQISYVYNSTGKIRPSYDEFLIDLKSQYSSIEWLLNSDFDLIFVSFDLLLNDESYRARLINYFRDKDIISNMQYDFSQSRENNRGLEELSKTMTIDESCLNLEEDILKQHEKFAHQLNEKLTKQEAERQQSTSPSLKPRKEVSE
jgi:hypothetical protein